MQTAIERVETLVVTVNHDRTIVEAVTAGKYDWANHNINDRNFPCEGKGTEQIEIILTRIDRPLRPVQILKVLVENNLRPANIQELLAIGEQHPEKQKSFWIFALESVWCCQHDNTLAPFLWKSDSGRILDLQWVGFVIGISSCVAVVQKLPA